MQLLLGQTTVAAGSGTAPIDISGFSPRGLYTVAGMVVQPPGMSVQVSVDEAGTKWVGLYDAGLNQYILDTTDRTRSFQCYGHKLRLFNNGAANSIVQLFYAGALN
jgi:hypothetical protein